MAISAGQSFGAVPPRPGDVRGQAPSVRLVDSRGLPVAAAVALAVGLAALGGAVDAATGSGLRMLFAICFCGGCLLAALFVRQDGLLTTVVMPPLVYVVVALAAGAVEVSDVAGGWLTQELLELATELVTGAPVLVTGTILAALVAALRRLAHIRRDVALRRRTPRQRPPEPGAAPAAWR